MNMIKKCLVLFLTCISISDIVFAQVDSLPVYEIKSDTIPEQIIDSIYWQRLEDPGGRWTFEEVRKEPLAGKFHIQADVPAIAHTSWQRYKLKNMLPYPVKIFLTSTADFFDVYIVRSNSLVTHYRNGGLRKWEEKDGFKSAEYMKGAIPLKLNIGEEVLIYDRRNLMNEDIRRIVVRFASNEKIMSQYLDFADSRENIFKETNIYEIFTAGLMLFSFLISLFFYRIVKEPVYLLFAFFSIDALLINLHNTAIFAYWFHPSLSWWVPFLFSFIPWLTYYYFLIWFVRKFFNVKNQYSKWDRILSWGGIFSVLLGAVGLVSYVANLEDSSFFNIYRLVSIIFIFGLYPLLILITIFLYFRQRNTSIRYLSIGIFPLMLTFIVSLFVILNIRSSNNSGVFLNWVKENSWLLLLVCMTWLVLWFVRVLMMKYVHLMKENAQQAIDKERERSELIASQKIQLETEVTERTAELKQSLEELKSTQSQLIQSEKMASLGELTAGIAHEIQNPLNFVNNFSDVNKELLTELKDEIKKGNTDEANAIADDVIGNEEKINHHGKRADAIVKGMLQHSRKSEGKKESTDINALCDEYLRLSYHGLRAKDKSFNAKFETDFDASLPKINVVQQDIGRVILNLINNAFYAVNERKKLNETGYEPTILVSTKRVNDKIEVSVKDNGTGIPEKIKDKIFQPFFTTKPTGSGTGLGLSLSYDIVKSHGGEIKIESKENEGTELVIFLPVI